MNRWNPFQVLLSFVGQSEAIECGLWSAAQPILAILMDGFFSPVVVYTVLVRGEDNNVCQNEWLGGRGELTH